MAWAGILAYATWPLYARLRRGLRGHATGSALVMTLLLMAVWREWLEETRAQPATAPSPDAQDRKSS